MALARCRECERPDGRTEPYVGSATPVGYPNSSTICGRSGCDNPALIWLNAQEQAAFQQGQCVFGFQTATAKVRVEPSS